MSDIQLKKEFNITSFKENINSDIQNVFFNVDEFAEKHLINNEEISIIIDNDRINDFSIEKLEFDPLNEVYQKMILFYIQKISLNFIPNINNNILFDGELFQIVDVSEDNGIIKVIIKSYNGR